MPTVNLISRLKKGEIQQKQHKACVKETLHYRNGF